MCGQAPENISHIRSECSELAGDEYKVQYDKVGSTCIEHAAGGRGGYCHNHNYHSQPGKLIATEVKLKFVKKQNNSQITACRIEGESDRASFNLNVCAG